MELNQNNIIQELEDRIIYLNEHYYQSRKIANRYLFSSQKLKEQIETLESTSVISSMKNQDLVRENQNLKKEIQNLQSSLSWKITYPLRMLSRIIRLLIFITKTNPKEMLGKIIRRLANKILASKKLKNISLFVLSFFPQLKISLSSLTESEQISPCSTKIETSDKKENLATLNDNQYDIYKSLINAIETTKS